MPYRIVTFFLRVFFTVFCKLERRGQWHEPDRPCLLIVNHISHFDPPAIGSALWRNLDFMAMEDLFKTKVTKSFFEACDVFPVSREKTDTTALRTAVKRMKAGRVVAMFPEGGIRSGKESITEKASLDDSIIMLAQMANVPVLPLLLLGTDHLYRWQNLFSRPRIVCYMGDYIDIPKNAKGKNERTELAGQLSHWFKKSMRQLLDEKVIGNDLIPRTAQEHWKNSKA